LLENRESGLLRQLDDDIWVVDHPFSMLGLEIGARTTVVRLQEGGLFLHSPGPLSVQLAKQLDAIGPVRCIVAPNLFHHLFVAENAKAYQAASIHLAPGLSSKRKDLSFNEELGDVPSSLWEKDLDQVLMQGAPSFNEVIFLHRASRTLLLTDLAFNVDHSPSLMTRIFFRLNGVYGRFGPSRLVRLMLRDRAAGRQVIDRILEWDFDRVILSHGEVLEQGGKEALREGYRWLVET
jgi:hypothetical protein